MMKHTKTASFILTNTLNSGSNNVTCSITYTLRGGVFIHYIEVSFQEFYVSAGASNEIAFGWFRLSKNQINSSTSIPGITFTGANVSYSSQTLYKYGIQKSSVYQSFLAGDTMSVACQFFTINPATAAINVNFNYNIIYSMTD
jgi:hypothetical protein